jgi:hypothetical protein
VRRVSLKALCYINTRQTGCQHFSRFFSPEVIQDVFQGSGARAIFRNLKILSREYSGVKAHNPVRPFQISTLSPFLGGECIIID